MMRQAKLSGYSIALNAFFVLFSLIFIVPLLVIINTSLMTREGVNTYGFTILPRMFDLNAYRYVFENPDRIVNAYKITILTSALVLVIYMLMASAAAYALSTRRFLFRRFFAFFLFFTMLFHGGLAPTYIWMTRYLHLKDTIWALIFPILENVWWVFIIRTYFQQLPDSLAESATLDGANEFDIYFRIVLPLSKPVLATIGVMCLLFAWSSWMPALLYINDKDLYPLQYLLQIMLRNVQQLMEDMEKMPAAYVAVERVPEEPVRMAMAVVVAGPMLVIFPFFQRYFVKGITIGSVKG